MRMCGTISPPILLKRESRSVMVRNPSSSMVAMSPVVYHPSRRVALAFEDQFGIRPLEGYGCTECSPVVAVNGKDFRAPGFRQVAAKRGKIGHPLPGVSVKVVDPETLEPVAAKQTGMLLVKGP